MQFGVCGDIKMAAIAAQAGFDFAEWSVGAFLKPRESEEAFAAMLAEVRAAKIPYPVVNVFVPGDLKITGPAMNFTALRQYVTTTCTRAETANVKIIVFGSGAARRIPEEFDPQTAHAQLLAFCAMTAAVAHEHGITIVVEPLNKAESNVLNTVAECAALVREVDHPALRLLVDAYHLLRDHDDYADIVRNADLLTHVHIATMTNRLSPGAEPCDLLPFFTALAQAGYTGRVTIEGNISDPAVMLPAALTLMKTLTQQATMTVSDQEGESLYE